MTSSAHVVCVKALPKYSGFPQGLSLPSHIPSVPGFAAAPDVWPLLVYKEMRKEKH